MNRRPYDSLAASVLAVVVDAVLTFSIATLVGFAIFILLFRLGFAGNIDILFYRGLVLCGSAFILTVSVVAWLGHITKRASLRDAIAAGFLSLGLNISVLVIAPVTIERSISLFILGYMSAHPDQVFTTDQIELEVRDGFLRGLNQVERRMNEQRKTGNVKLSNGGYTISPQGMSFIAWSKRTAWLFGVDQCLIDPERTYRSPESASCGTGNQK